VSSTVAGRTDLARATGKAARQVFTRELHMLLDLIGFVVVVLVIIGVAVGAESGRH
jgi:uncharacterized iron-regulated membrane protein